MEESDETSGVRQRNIAVERVFQRATLGKSLLFSSLNIRGNVKSRFMVMCIVVIVYEKENFSEMCCQNKK